MPLPKEFNFEPNQELVASVEKLFSWADSLVKPNTSDNVRACALIILERKDIVQFHNSDFERLMGLDFSHVSQGRAYYWARHDGKPPRIDVSFGNDVDLSESEFEISEDELLNGRDGLPMFFRASQKDIIRNPGERWHTLNQEVGEADTLEATVENVTLLQRILAGGRTISS